MESKILDLKYTFQPGATMCYMAEGITSYAVYQPDPIDTPDQIMELIITVKSLFEDRGGRIHLLISSIPRKLMQADQELPLPDMRRVYTMIDNRGNIIESTDAANMFIYPFPPEPVPLGHQWEREELIQPVDRPEPILLKTYYTLEKECDIEGIPHLQVNFQTPTVCYTSEHEATKGSTITYSREGVFFFDPKLGQISGIEQTSLFSSEHDAGRIETSFQSTFKLGEIILDPSMLPKSI